MSGAGEMPAGVGPFGGDYQEWQPLVRAQIPSSRSSTTTNEQGLLNDGTGGYAGMPDSIQRADYALCRAFFRDDSVIGPAFVATRQAKVRTALAFLTEGDEPALELIRVDVFDNGGSRTATEIEVKDRDSGQVKVLKYG